MTIDLDQYRVWIAGAPVHLTHKEFELLLRLAESADRVVPRETLLGALWARPSPDCDRRLNALVLRLRRKLATSDPWTIETVTRRGYTLVDRATLHDRRS